MIFAWFSILNWAFLFYDKLTAGVIMKTFLSALFLLMSGFTLAKTHKVEMLNMSNGKNMVFKPGFLKIEPGDKVKFVPKSLGHNTQSVYKPERAEDWKSENSQEFTVSFDQEGIYIYECQNHAVLGMAGVIQVGEASDLEGTEKFLKDYQKKLVMDKERLKIYLKKAE
jgi:pseudoazurin